MLRCLAPITVDSTLVHPFLINPILIRRLRSFAMLNIWLWVFIALMLALCPIIYNLFFHPLRHFPGPRLAAATTWWKAYKEVYRQETLAQVLFELHEKHGEDVSLVLVMYSNVFTGDIVRIGPNEVCCPRTVECPV
jgi:hypothetical protein